MRKYGGHDDIIGATIVPVVGQDQYGAAPNRGEIAKRHGHQHDVSLSMRHSRPRRQ
jgi:hypothetical protein